MEYPARYLSILSRNMRMFFDRGLKSWAIGFGQVPIIRALSRKEGMTQEEIRSHFGLDRGTAARSIRPLVDGGYIERQKQSSDQRAYSIHFTEKGNELKGYVHDLVEKWTEILFSGMEESERIAAMSLFSRMTENSCSFIAERKKRDLQ